MKCLRPDCDSEPEVRGLCKSCYMTARYLVATNKTSWSELERSGRAFRKAETKPKTSWFLGGGSK